MADTIQILTPISETIVIQSPPKSTIQINSQGGGAAIDLTPIKDTINEVKEVVVESKPTPFASAKDNILTLYMVTVKQMERLLVHTSAGLVKFNVTFDEDNYYLAYSDDSPAPITGTAIENDAKSLYDNNYIETIELTFPDGWTISIVSFDDTDNILEQGDAWRLADIQKRIGKGGDDAHNLAAFFNITEATEYTALTPAEAIAIARDCQYNVMGTDWPIPTWLPTGVTEAQVESAAEGLGIPYHEPTQTA